MSGLSKMAGLVNGQSYEEKNVCQLVFPIILYICSMGYSDVVNACGLSYARLYSEIEQRYENEQYYKVDGTPLTKEDEIEWLDIQFEQEAAWQKSCARIAAQGQVIQGKIFEMPTKEMEELEDSFYQAKDAYMKLYRESRQVGKPLVLQNYIFGNGRMYEVLNRLGNLQERVE